MNENPPTASPPPPVSQGNGAKLARLKSPWFQWPAAAGFAVLLYLGLSYLGGFLTHESTDDAFIEGHVVSVAPRVDGQVLAVPVLDNQFVRSNDLLVELDPADYAITVAQKEAAALSQNANLRTMIAAYELMHTKVATAEAAARVANADADAAGATAKKTQADLDRASDLLKQKTISQQEFDAAQAASTKAQAGWKSAQDHAAEQ